MSTPSSVRSTDIVAGHPPRYPNGTRVPAAEVARRRAARRPSNGDAASAAVMWMCWLAILVGFVGVPAAQLVLRFVR